MKKYKSTKLDIDNSILINHKHDRSYDFSGLIVIYCFYILVTFLDFIGFKFKTK